jgi:hypothetical protein
MRRILLFLPLLIFSSCFHKDVMSDRADDVVRSLIYKGTEGTFIITKEEIFQATSKKSGGGITTISGHSDYRITSYDLATGQQLGRVDMGDGIEKSFTILGTTPGKVWLYSMDEELGFHCRNVKTMELISDEKTLTASAPLKGLTFARPEWMKLNQFYGWNASNNKLMLTDMQGFHYYFDPEKGTLDKTEDEIKDYEWAVSYFSSTGYFSEDVYVTLRGDARQKLMYESEDSTAKLSYLTAELLLENDPLHDLARKQAYIDSLDRSLAMWKDSLVLLEKEHPKLLQNGVINTNHFDGNEYRATWKANEIIRNIEDLKLKKKSQLENDRRLVDTPLLSDAPGNLFVIHATDVSDTSKAVLTKVHLSGRTFTEAWTTKLPGFYRDAQKADSRGAFETVFSDGNPEFTYRWHALVDGKLLLIGQLSMICIDAQSGKILWQQPL